MSSVLSHLAQSGRPLVHSASCGVTLLDVDGGAPIGEDPPVSDVLAWDTGGTSLPEQFLGSFRDNSLTRPDDVPVLGWPVDLSRIDVPTFVSGAVDDHLTPWTGCCRTTALPSGPGTSVLSDGGYIAGLIDPPGTTGAPAGLGSERHPSLGPAPGAYVLDREPVPERVSSGPPGRRP